MYVNNNNNISVFIDKRATTNMKKTPTTKARDCSTRTKEGILSSAWNPDNLTDQRAHNLADKIYIKE